jgi:hypothetical protein
MAYVANLQRETFNETLVRAGFPTVIATFQINKLNRGGGQYPYSLFKIQANWYLGSQLVNSELYVTQCISDDSGTPIFSYLPSGKSPEYNKFPIYSEILPPQNRNQIKYSHLLFSDDANIYDYFWIEFTNIRDDTDPEYYLIDVVVNTPNINDGNLIADSYCYILNTI